MAGSIATLMQQLRDAGAPMEAIMIAVAAVEAVEAKHAAAEEARKADQRERSRTYRDRGGGQIHWALRAAVLDRDGHTCVYCGSRAARFHCDHVTPVIQGGETTFENLATACATCNASKGGRTPKQWGGPWL